jgi:hypothetical protein
MKETMCVDCRGEMRQAGFTRVELSDAERAPGWREAQ